MNYQEITFIKDGVKQIWKGKISTLIQVFPESEIIEIKEIE